MERCAWTWVLLCGTSKAFLTNFLFMVQKNTLSSVPWPIWNASFSITLTVSPAPTTARLNISGCNIRAINQGKWRTYCQGRNLERSYFDQKRHNFGRNIAEMVPLGQPKTACFCQKYPLSASLLSVFPPKVQSFGNYGDWRKETPPVSTQTCVVVCADLLRLADLIGDLLQNLGRV